MSRIPVAIVGAGPYGLSVAAHLAAHKIEHRIFGKPMEFWSKIAAAGDRRFLKSYCFGTNISTPSEGFSFADYSAPRGLETFEPCSMGHFADYGRWFQQNIVPWVEPVDVSGVEPAGDGFGVTLTNGERLVADRVVLATGLGYYASVPQALGSLPPERSIHTSAISDFTAFKGRRIGVIGAGQSALEAAALLLEAGAQPHLLVRANGISWHHRVFQQRSLWRRLRSPISGLGTGPKAWGLTNFPGAMHRVPTALRRRFVSRHLPAEGAWWLRERVEKLVPVNLNTTVAAAREEGGQLMLKLYNSATKGTTDLTVDHIVSGSGYTIDVDSLPYLDAELKRSIRRIETAPKLSSRFESSVPGLHFVGPSSAMSFGPLYRFVVGAGYTARTVSTHIASRRPRPVSVPLGSKKPLTP